jgi:hypothetical protein
MASSMHCSKKRLIDGFMRNICACLLLFVFSQAWAQTPVEITQFEVERSSEEVLLNAQLQFELPPVIEDALLKGVPVYFRAETDVLRERWYWYDKVLFSAARSYKIAFQPLTRRWRVSVSAGGLGSAGQGLALSQSYDTLTAAMASVKKVSRWRIAGAQELEATGRNRLEFRFLLDASQLPRPFQISLLGQADWEINLSRSQPLVLDAVK